MSEFVDLFKVIIEKGGFKTFLFSVAIAIVSNKLWLNDWLWAIVVFCSCYLLTYLILCVFHHLKKKYDKYVKTKNMIEENKRYREEQIKKINLIFNSLDENTKEALRELYSLPEQEFANKRILNHSQCNSIFSRCCRLDKYHFFKIEKCCDSYIVTIDIIFYDVIGEHFANK